VVVAERQVELSDPHVPAGMLAFDASWAEEILTVNRTKTVSADRQPGAVGRTRGRSPCARDVQASGSDEVGTTQAADR
jgi:hypothetical protein